MKNLILMSREKANSMTDEELAEEIAKLESGTRKLILHDETGRPVNVGLLALPMLKRVQQERQNKEAK
jgi:hypothetical protein